MDVFLTVAEIFLVVEAISGSSTLGSGTTSIGDSRDPIMAVVTCALGFGDGGNRGLAVVAARP